MPPAVCTPQIQADAMRISKLYASGVPAQGASNLLVTDSLVSLQYTVEQEAGDEFIVKGASGALCLNYKDCDRIKRLTITLSICTPSPYVHEFLAGGVVLTDGAAVGYGFPSIADPDCPNGVSVELWAKRVTAGGSPDPDYPYNWWAFPRMYLNIDSATFENGPFQPTFTGFAVENENWFDGPTNDWPVDSDRVAQFIPTTDKPTAACAPVALVAS